MFSKNEVAKAMKKDGVVAEFEQRSRIFEESARLSPETVADFLERLPPGLEKRLGKHAMEELRAANKHAKQEPLQVESFVSVNDGHVEVLLPLKYAPEFTGLLKAHVDHSKSGLATVGRVYVQDYNGLVNLTARVRHPEKLSEALDALGQLPEEFSKAGIEYSLHVYRSATQAQKDEDKPAPAPKRAARSSSARGQESPSRIAVYDYLKDNESITPGKLAELTGMTAINANALLGYEYRSGKLKRLERGVYGLKGKRKKSAAPELVENDKKERMVPGELQRMVFAYLDDNQTINVDAVLSLGAKSRNSALTTLNNYTKKGLLESVSDGTYAKPGYTVSGHGVRKKSATESVLEYVGINKQVTANDVMKERNCSRGTANQLLSELYSSGVLARIKKGVYVIAPPTGSALPVHVDPVTPLPQGTAQARAPKGVIEAPEAKDDADESHEPETEILETAPASELVESLPQEHAPAAYETTRRSVESYLIEVIGYVVKNDGIVNKMMIRQRFGAEADAALSAVFQKRDFFTFAGGNVSLKGGQARRWYDKQTEKRNIGDHLCASTADLGETQRFAAILYHFERQPMSDGYLAAVDELLGVNKSIKNADLMVMVDQGYLEQARKGAPYSRTEAGAAWLNSNIYDLNGAVVVRGRAGKNHRT